ncbi:hypothetical protein ACP4OV_013275 [Aristida adscensionis]
MDENTTMAPQLCTDTNSSSSGDALALAVPLCLLHDLLAAAAFLASHPLHAAYLLFFSRHLAAAAAFLWPLLASTALLLAVLATVAPYAARGGGGSPEWPGVWSLGRTCGIAVAALCSGLRPDGGGAGLVGQLCSFVLGPGDAASVLRVGEIMGELCDIGGSCFLLEDEEEEKSLPLLINGECKELAAFELPLMDCLIGEITFLGHEDFGEIKEEIDDKVVISEDLKVADSWAEQCCPNETMLMGEMEAEEEQENGIQEQGLILSDMDVASDGVEEKRLECDPVSVEIKKCEAVESKEMMKYEPVKLMEIKSELEPVEPVEIKKSEAVESFEIKRPEPVKPRSSVARRIKLWEAQVSGNMEPVLEAMKENSAEFSLETAPFTDVKAHLQFEVDICDDKCGNEQQAQEVAYVEHSVEQEQEQEFKDVKECMLSETVTFSENCSQDMQVQESAPIVHSEDELQEEDCKDVQPESEFQEQQHSDAQPEQELQEREEQDYREASESAVMCSERENSLKSTSIAGRVHTRSSSENLVGEGSSPVKEKEWKRTLACKLYEERMQLKLCRDRAVVEGSDNMDMLWEAYEVGSGSNGAGNGAKRGSGTAKSPSIVQEESVEEGEGEEEDEDDGEDEGSVRQLCCLQALKFSTRKMNFGGGKPSLAKVSKILKRMTALSRVGSRRNHKG